MSDPATRTSGFGSDAMRLFERALELEAGARVTFLTSQCGDEALRREVEGLLAAHDALEKATEPDAGFLTRLDARRTAALLAAASDDDVEFTDLPQRVGRYRMIRPLGRGGMGVVGLAHDADLDRLVAIKLLPRDVAADGDARARFITEARSASALDHPSIATIYEIGETDEGRLFIAMSYHGDTTVRSRIAEGPLAVQDAVRIACDVAEGLSRAHERGIVHRDIKPANLIVTPDGGVRIIDFGLAKLAGTAITRPEHRVGTAAYMSPEQTRGQSLDGRSDIWSLGVVMYEMLAGSRPFAQESLEGLVHAIRHDSPSSLAERRPDVPPALAALVARCLEKDPDRRVQSATGLAQLLRSIGSAPERAVPDVRSRRRAAIGVGVVLIAVLAGGLAVATRAFTGGQAEATAPPSIAVLPFMNVGGDTATAYLADGITEDVLSTLGQVSGLRVVARTSPFALRGAPDANAIARRLGVEHLLEGSVQRSADRLRVVVRLTKASDGVQLWSRRYDRPATDLFILEDEISRAVAAVLQLKVMPPSDATAGLRPLDLQAHDLYLRGRYAWNRRTEAGFREAVEWFRAAVRRDSTYAAAYAGLSDAYRLLGTYGFLPGNESFEESAVAARRAVELAPRSGEAHAALAGTFQARGQYQLAEDEFRRAIALDPAHANARHWYAFLLATQGRLVEARQQMAEARALDPLSVPIRVTEARFDLQAGAFRQAMTSLEEGIAIDSANPWAWYALALARAQAGRIEDGLDAIGSALALVPGEPRLTGAHAALRVATGDTAIAAALLERLRRGRSRESVAYALATTFAALHEPDSAFAWLARVPWNSEYLFSLRMDPLLEPLRADSRYEALGTDLGLPRWP